MAVMELSPAEDGRHDEELPILWAAMLAGPAAWTLNQGLGYVLIKAICAGSATSGLWLIAAAALALAAGGAWLGWRYVQRFQPKAAEDGPAAADRSYFLAILALALDLLIVVLIVTSAVPQFVLTPCE